MGKTYPPPGAAIDPDPSRSWLRRAWPLARAHGWMFGPALVMSGAGLLVAVFPASFLIQARLAEVAAVVDENINGVRVVKSFAAERSQLSLLQKAATKVSWANVKDADLRARWTPLVQNLPRVGMAIVLLEGRIIEVGPHDQLVAADGKYSQVYATWASQATEVD